jgi:hypothetical protein
MDASIFGNRFPRRGVLTEAPRCVILYHTDNWMTQTEIATKRSSSMNSAVTWILHNTCSNYTNQTHARPRSENCALLGYYAASNGNFSPTFRTTYRSHLQGSRIKKKYWPLKMWQIVCPKTSIINYQYSSRNNPEEHNSHVLQGGSLKSCKMPRSDYALPKPDAQKQEQKYRVIKKFLCTR